MKKKTDIVFIVLVYRNYNDLKDLYISLTKNVKARFELVVVDAFFSNETSKKIIELSEELSCFYLFSQNGGYGYGNNRGLEFADKMFDYKYICICNPDTVLKTEISIEQFENEVCIAPRIITARGKNQNPYWAYENSLSERLIYQGYKKERKMCTYFGVILNKLLKGLFLVENKYGNKKQIYACHGSFFFLNASFIKNHLPLFDERMFLFYEEAYLARVLKNNGDKIKYDRNIVIYHKEDGSMNIAQIKEYPHLKDSYILYYERYRQ